VCNIMHVSIKLSIAVIMIIIMLLLQITIHGANIGHIQVCAYAKYGLNIGCILANGEACCAGSVGIGEISLAIILQEAYR